MTRAVRLYPYEVAQSLDLTLRDFDDPVTGVNPSVREIRRGSDGGFDREPDESSAESSVRSYDATTREQPWAKLTFRLEVVLPAEDLQRVLPETSNVDEDTALSVLVTCPATKFRHGVRLVRSRDGRWAGVTTLQREDVRSIVTLRPQLVRTTSIPSDEPTPFAKRAGSVIAMGEPVHVYVDTEPRLLQSTVNVAWDDFSNSDNPWRREHAEDVYHLEPFGAEPQLYLNSRYSQLRELLESNVKRGPAAALRELAAALVAQPVLVQLSMAALASLALDEDSGDVELPNGWRGDLLAKVLPRLIPEEADERERARRAARDMQDPDGAASLAGRLGTAVQDMIASYKAVEAAIRAYETVRETEEPAND